MGQPLWRAVRKFFKLNTESPWDSAIPRPGVSPREFKTMYTQKPVHSVYSSLTHNSQRTENACASQLMDAAAAGGTRPQWNTTQPPKGAGHRHSAARGRGAGTPSARSPRDATECAIPPARGVHGGRSWINGCGARAMENGDGEWEGPLTAAGLPGEVDMRCW